jgi:phosphoribosylformylglycinamidine synthase
MTISKIKSKPKILVLCGNAINCDHETAFAVEEAGGKAERVLVKNFLDGKQNLNDYDGTIIPGGFSYGDDVAAGKLLAMNMRNHLSGQVRELIDAEKLVWGICNGFQVLAYMGLDDKGIDYDNNELKTTCLPNESGMFWDNWVYLKVPDNSKCVITKGLDKIRLPIRNGEGNVYAAAETIKALKKNGQVAMRYIGSDGNENPDWPENPNGSVDNIAGLCDPTGRGIGIFPHPEAAIQTHHYPTWTRNRQEAEENAEKARLMFKNFVDYFR